MNHGLLYLQSHNYFRSEKDREAKYHPFFTVAGLGDGSGFGAGLLFTQRAPLQSKAELSGQISNHLYQQYTFRLGRDFGPVHTGPEAGLAYLPEQDFFGEGPDSIKSDRTNYSETARSVGWATTAKFGRLELRHVLGWRRYDVSEGKDSRFATTQSVFSPAEVSGGYAGTRWLTNEFGGFLDHRDDRNDPKSGDGLDASLTLSQGLGATTSDLRTLHIVNTTYIPLSKQRFHVLAFRAEAISNLGDDPVPFYLQPTLGGSLTLRGFREYRFHDQDALALTAEYRYRIWRCVDATVFGDTGQVYENLWKDIGNHRLNAAAGMGFRLNASAALRARLSVGFSHEGTRVFVTLGSIW